MSAPHPDLTCKEIVELVTEYLEGKLPHDERTRFEMHLCYCDWCVTYLDQMRAVKALSAEAVEEAIPEETRDALLEAFRGWKRGQGGGAP
jgi:anti-sigma factor (TIGR02949 family)